MLYVTKWRTILSLVTCSTKDAPIHEYGETEAHIAYIASLKTRTLQARSFPQHYFFNLPCTLEE